MSCLGRGIAVLTVNEGTTSIDTKRIFQQVYAFTELSNPFIHQHNSFSIPYSGFTTLKVFDILGNEVATL